MFKIYRAFVDEGKIKIEDYIKFTNGKFDTGLNGFGQVKTGNYACTKANYELQSLKYYKNYLQSIKKCDGYVEDFAIINPYSYQMLEDEYRDVDKNFDVYEQYGLNEEGILLFTDWVRLSYPLDESVQRIFGRYPENGMYLIMPNASFDMIMGTFSGTISESYEVLQSQSLGKRLVLEKMNRKI